VSAQPPPPGNALGDRSPRDPRRVWARFLPRHRAFRHPAAVELAGWAGAILHHETYTVWLAAHPEGGPL